MNLAIETFDLRKRFGDEKAISLIKEAGFDGIDYSFYGADMMQDDDYREYAQHIKSVLNENNIVCNQAHAPFDFVYGEEMNENNTNYRHMLRSLEFASILGVENIIVHAINVPKGVDLFEYNMKYYKSFEQACEKFKIHIAIENLFSYDQRRKCFVGIFSTPSELINIVKSLDSPWYVACFDIGHSSITGTEPEDFISEMNCDVLKSLHVQDNDYLGDRHWLPYAGDLNWNGICNALAKIRYNGDFTLEVFNYLNKFDDELIPEALKFAHTTGRYLINKIESM